MARRKGFEPFGRHFTASIIRLEACGIEFASVRILLNPPIPTPLPTAGNTSFLKSCCVYRHIKTILPRCSTPEYQCIWSPSRGSLGRAGLTAELGLGTREVVNKNAKVLIYSPPSNSAKFFTRFSLISSSCLKSCVNPISPVISKTFLTVSLSFGDCSSSLINLSFRSA